MAFKVWYAGFAPGYPLVVKLTLPGGRMLVAQHLVVETYRFHLPPIQNRQTDRHRKIEDRLWIF